MGKFTVAREKLIQLMHDEINIKSENYNLNLLTYHSTILNLVFYNRYQDYCGMNNEIVYAPERI
jgi:hypothetical protein